MASLYARPQTDIESDIQRHNNVPVSLAAEYLGISEVFVRYGIRASILPIGTYMKRGERCAYHISPGKLLAYQRGE